MPLDLDATRCWEALNDCNGNVALAIHELRGEPDHRACGEALMLMEGAKRKLLVGQQLLDRQIEALADTLRTRP